jgi:hypothetical protein
MSRPLIIDANGHELDIGDPIRCGQGSTGTLVEFHEPDESHWKVAVEWPEYPGDPEIFHAAPIGPPWVTSTERCNDIEKAVS